jgi:hypothetical protein
MELLISMKAEYINKGIYFKESAIMQMPTAQTSGHFVAEYREGDEEKLLLLNRYVDILKQKLSGKEDFFVQETSFGFKLLKPVDNDMEYMDAWADWVMFTRGLLRELKEVVGD